MVAVFTDFRCGASNESNSVVESLKNFRGFELAEIGFDWIAPRVKCRAVVRVVLMMLSWNFLILKLLIIFRILLPWIRHLITVSLFSIPIIKLLPATVRTQFMIRALRHKQQFAHLTILVLLPSIFSRSVISRPGAQFGHIL
jgi:hypothetical protein